VRKGLKVFLIVFASLFLFLIASLITRYLIWQGHFESNINQLVCVSNSSEDVSFDKKVEDFVLSSDKTSFIELTPADVVSLLKNTSKSDDIQINDLCAIPDNGQWRLYIRATIQGVIMPWLGIDVAKDNMETAQLYISDIYIGDWEVPKRIANGIEQRVNMGISDALVLVNENNFLGRKIENIELLKEKVVIKGSTNN
jgi:hypothetical protein